jgi:hypothetical protein
MPMGMAAKRYISAAASGGDAKADGEGLVAHGRTAGRMRQRKR